MEIWLPAPLPALKPFLLYFIAALFVRNSRVPQVNKFRILDSRTGALNLDHYIDSNSAIWNFLGNVHYCKPAGSRSVAAVEVSLQKTLV